MEKIIKLDSDEEAISLYGSLDERLRFAEEKFKVRISARNHRLVISGSKENVRQAAEFFNAELERIREGGSRHSESKISKAAQAPHPGGQAAEGSQKTPLSYFHKGKVIKAKSKNQENYLQAIQQYDIVISIGPAGTGKTYLAMATAIDALKRKRVTRIILTRPAVEAGESLGFLPGDLYAKINPYLRPLYDALYDMMDFDEATRHLQRGLIEVAPLAYMRGRTLNDSFVILDEGQNCTHEQMKMFLTRLGFSSRTIVTGDITQIDLPSGKRSGLVEIQTILHDVEGIKFCYLDEKDVVRHKLVQDVIKAYERHEKK
ncbi:MAG: PhoH family protein [Candidatus Omnitrophica bacterium]|nr:PhoH family protein [Candidatus Omnitrophota bacterium]